MHAVMSVCELCGSSVNLPHIHCLLHISANKEYEHLGIPLAQYQNIGYRSVRFRVNPGKYQANPRFESRRKRSVDIRERGDLFRIVAIRRG